MRTSCYNHHLASGVLRSGHPDLAICSAISHIRMDSGALRVVARANQKSVTRINLSLSVCCSFFPYRIGFFRSHGPLRLPPVVRGH